MSSFKMINKAIIQFNLHIITGIHVGGTKDIYGIGGVDSPVLKDPLTGQPIIPGSSIKGKLRSLLELSDTSLINHVIFEGNDQSPTRGIFRDLKMHQTSADELQKVLGSGIFTEVKAENTIDPYTGKTKKGGLRFIERVPAGTIFQGEIIVNAFTGDEIVAFVNLIKRGFELLEYNYLGGSGSRGYGKVKFEIISESIQ